MINGHGDDLHNYGRITSNFSSNIYAGFSHEGLFAHLRDVLHLITSYPEPSPLSLERRLAELHGVAADQVLVTNGATEAIYLIARAFRDRKAIIHQPTFAEYADACRDCDGVRRMQWLCVPNNPTGQVMPRQELLGRIADSPDDLFILDASYAAYTRQPVVTPAEAVACGNVLMLCSMTKDYGVPGLRLGYVVGDARLLAEVRSHCMPWSVNALAIAAGHFLLQHRSDYRLPVDLLLSERRRMEAALHAMGIATAPSDANMLLCLLPHGTAAQLKDYLATQHGILIRDASNFQTLTPRHFRIAVQTEAQNDALIKAIEQWI